MKNILSSKTVTFCLIIFLILGFLFIGFNNVYIDFLWFKEVDYTQVFFCKIISRLQMFVAAFIFTLLSSFFYFKFLANAVNSRTLSANSKTDNKRIFLVSIIISSIISFISTNALWYKFLEFMHSVDFHTSDSLFNKDISFYIFKLPFLESLFQVILITWFIFGFASIILTIAAYSTNPSRSLISEEQDISFKTKVHDFTNFAFREIGIFIGILFLIISFHFYLRSFHILYSNSGFAYGASYTDVNIALRINIILRFLSILFAILSFTLNLRGKLKTFLAGSLLIMLISIIAAVAIIGVDRFIVSPNQYAKEKIYISRNIEATKAAYGLDKIVEKDFILDRNLNLDSIKSNRAIIDNIPINDYRPTLDMFNSIQGFRVYYEFNDIDIDRYWIEDKYTQVFISAREMNNDKLDENALTWYNIHLKYTHGYGVAAAPVNTINDSGQPQLIVQDIPPDTSVPSLQITEPRIYFGESTNTYAITNAKSMEFDYPQGSENIENYYEGNAGIKLNLLNRLAFSMYHRDFKIMLSSEIQSESKMLIHRNIIDRVHKIASFLTFDEDPYIVIDDGKLYWIIDGFTLSNRYPYSTPYDEEQNFNYIRNSVKIVIDAYNGSVDFYQVDKEDPIIGVYNRIYKGMFKPIEDMPETLRSHVRYSQAMFDIQANIYSNYHMNDPAIFYNNEDEWEIAKQMYGQDKEVESVESAYLIMKQVEEGKEELVLMVPYTPRDRDNMIAWMAAMNDIDNYGKLVVSKFPKHNLVYGPMQIEQRIDQDTVISPQLTLLGQQGSKITRGNMLTIPVNKSILYVEPIYVESSSEGSKIPEVKKVIVSYNNKIVMEDTLELALEALFGSNKEETTEHTTPSTPQDRNALIEESNQLLNKIERARSSGNLEEVREYLRQLEEVLQELD